MKKQTKKYDILTDEEIVCEWCGEGGEVRQYVTSPPLDSHPVEEAYLHEQCAAQQCKARYA